MTTTVVADSILAQCKWVTETITAELVDRIGSYCYRVGIHGGMHHGVEILCHTEHSAMWVFGLVVARRKTNTEWAWLR